MKNPDNYYDWLASDEETAQQLLEMLSVEDSPTAELKRAAMLGFSAGYRAAIERAKAALEKAITSDGEQ